LAVGIEPPGKSYNNQGTLDRLTPGNTNKSTKRQLKEQWALQRVALFSREGFARRNLEIQLPLKCGA